MNRFLCLLIVFLTGGMALQGQVLEGIASYYGPRFHGRSTSTGETFDKNALTCAAKVFPYGSILSVTNIETGATVQVRVNDCGPAVDDRIIDLSERAAQQIGIGRRHGLATVRVEVLEEGRDGPTCNRGAWARGGRRPIDWADLQKKFKPSASASTPSASQGPVTRGAAAATEVDVPSPRPPVAPSAPTVNGSSDSGSSEEEATATASAALPETGPLYAVQLVATRRKEGADEFLVDVLEAGFEGSFVERGPDRLYRVFSKRVAALELAKYWKGKLEEAGYKGLIRQVR